MNTSTVSQMQRLEQITQEDKYDKRHIRTKVLEDLQATQNIQFDTAFIQACRNIEDYCSKSYFPAKNARISKVIESGHSPENIVTEILIAVMSHAGAQPIQGVAAQIGALFDFNDMFDGVKVASDLIAECCFADLYDIIPASNSDTGSLMVQAKFALEESTLQAIADTKYLPPMIVPPNKVNCNTDSGYLTREESLILGKNNHHNKPLAYDAINIASQVALSLDLDMLGYEETPKHPLDTQEKSDNFRRMVNSSKVVYKDLLAFGNKFYFAWKADSRGRVYSQGYHVNIQSSEYKKAIIDLHQKHEITGV